MAALNKTLLEVSPAYHNRRASIVLLDTAEELVESLDNLSICLKHIEEKYLEVMFKFLSLSLSLSLSL